MFTFATQQQPLQDAVRKFENPAVAASFLMALVDNYDHLLLPVIN